MIQTLTDLILNLKLADDWVAFIPSFHSLTCPRGQLSGVTI